MFTNLLQKSRFAIWNSYFGLDYWIVGSGDGSWNEGGWWDSELVFSSQRLDLQVWGGWAHDLRPYAMRLTYTGMTPASMRLVQLEDSEFDNLIYESILTPPGTPSLAELTITWGTHNLEFITVRSYDGSDPWKLTNIEFGFS